MLSEYDNLDLFFVLVFETQQFVMGRSMNFARTTSTRTKGFTMTGTISNI